MTSVTKSALAGALIGAVALVLLVICWLTWVFLQIGMDSYHLAQATGGSTTIFTVPFIEDASGRPISAANFFGRVALAGAVLGAISGAIVGLARRIRTRKKQTVHEL